MELCQGSIKSLIKQHLIKFSEGTARDMLKDICKALAYIHRDKVVHLDIKPGNLLFFKFF
jgi:serine/threonine protein kinase